MADEVPKKTVGALALEAAATGDKQVDAVELERAIHKGDQNNKSYDESIEEIVIDGLKVYEGDFFIIVMHKRERLMPNVIRNYFMHRKSCPTPAYDQIVYKFQRKGSILEQLWVIPDKETYWYLLHNRANLPLDQQQLIEYVTQDFAGDLLRLAQKLNGELV